MVYQLNYSLNSFVNVGFGNSKTRRFSRTFSLESVQTSSWLGMCGRQGTCTSNPNTTSQDSTRSKEFASPVCALPLSHFPDITLSAPINRFVWVSLQCQQITRASKAQPQLERPNHPASPLHTCFSQAQSWACPGPPAGLSRIPQSWLCSDFPHYTSCLSILWTTFLYWQTTIILIYVY